MFGSPQRTRVKSALDSKQCSKPFLDAGNWLVCRRLAHGNEVRAQSVNHVTCVFMWVDKFTQTHTAAWNGWGWRPTHRGQHTHSDYGYLYCHFSWFPFSILFQPISVSHFPFSPPALHRPVCPSLVFWANQPAAPHSLNELTRDVTWLQWQAFLPQKNQHPAATV